MVKLYIIYEYKSIFPQLAGSALTDALICSCMGREDIEVRRTEDGKPHVCLPEGDSGRPYISVSHSSGTFALAVSGGEVGLDIQYARDVKRQKIAARYFTEEEAASVAADDTGDRFFELWTRKEAYGKYTGKGLASVASKEPVDGREDVRFTDLRLEDGCFCSICTGADEGESYEIQISYGE